MRDPYEGVGPGGEIKTGADRARVAPVFEPVLAAATDLIGPTGGTALYLYGSVATGRARPWRSDVDLVTIGVPADVADVAGAELSTRFAAVCRAVEVGAAQPEDYAGDGDEAYGNRAFLRHYCVHVAGASPHVHLPDVPADVHAARGFNGDIGQHALRWSDARSRGDDPVRLGRRIARKTLLAVAGLVSIRDRTWTTDRETAAARWADVEPGVRTLLDWIEHGAAPTRDDVRRALEGPVARIVIDFEATIGRWP